MKIKTEVSAHHIHLSQKDSEILFGKNHQFKKHHNLSQPGQYATKETLIAKSKKRTIKDIRIILPFREKSQFEITLTEALKLKIRPAFRLSGRTFLAPKLKIIGPKGKVRIPAIIPIYHLHISEKEAKKMNLKHKQKIKIKVKNLIFENVIVRVSPKYKLSFHLNTDEANSAEIKKYSYGKIVH